MGGKESKKVNHKNSNVQTPNVQYIQVQQNTKNQQVYYIPQTIPTVPTQGDNIKQVYIHPNQFYMLPQSTDQRQVQLQPQYIIVNQTFPRLEDIKKLPAWPTRLICPFCNNSIKTIIKEDFNYCVCVTLYILIILSVAISIPFVICCAALGGNCRFRSSNSQNPPRQNIEKEENKPKHCCCCNCYDVTHICPYCSKTIGFSAYWC